MEIGDGEGVTFQQKRVGLDLFVGAAFLDLPSPQSDIVFVELSSTDS